MPTMSPSQRKLPITPPMPVDPELLGSCGYLLESEIYSEGGYSLCRVKDRGRSMVAEISPVTDVPQHRWPSVKGLIMPVAVRDLPGSRKLLLFDAAEMKFLWEAMGASGGFSEERALDLIGKALSIVTGLQASGMVCGYLGPEMFLLSGNDVFLLAGRRGVPVSPFTAPEVGNSRPSDPRSDVWAIGSLLFRIMAGTDDASKQREAWNNLSSPLKSAIMKMVSVDPVDRPVSLREVRNILRRLSSKEAAGTPGKPEAPVVNSEGFIRKTSSGGGSSMKARYWYIAAPLILAAAFLVFRFSGPPSDAVVSPGEPGEADSVFFHEEPEAVSPWAEDTLEEVSATQPPHLLEDTVTIWVSNCSGEEGLENQFRADPLGRFSFVYPLTGSSQRRTSLVLVRRADPSTDPRETDIWRLAGEIASTDTAFTVRPVDLTIMLGTDLSYADVNAHLFRSPAGPADTLFVDVVNHGIQYLLGGTTAAAYTGGMLHGRACTIGGTEYILSVEDIRDAHRYDEEVGIPRNLNETIFMHNPGNHIAAELEVLIRQYFQALPGQGGYPRESIPVPDISIFLGSQGNI